MRIDNKFITSVECLKKHFNFPEIFSNIDIFVRDLSPNNIPYFDESSKLLYDIISAPHFAQVEGDSFVFLPDNQVYILKSNEISILEHSALSEYTLGDKIRIVALYELIGQQVDYTQVETQALDSPLDEDIVLTRGQSLVIIESKKTEKLFYRLIRTKYDANSETEYCVGDMKLKAGSIAYGLFSRFGLYKMIKPFYSNNSYKLRLIDNGGSAVLRVTDIANKQEQLMPEVKAFCTLGDDNYLYIANNRLYSHHNSKLEKEISKHISIFDTPLAVEVIEENIVVTMQDSTEKIINYIKIL